MLDPLSSLVNSGQGSSLDKLVSMYMALERKPVDTLKTRKDQLSVQSAVFTDLRSRIDDLRDLAEKLSEYPNTVFTAHTVTSSDSTIATATVSTGAANGKYTLADIVLATADRRQSQQVSKDWTVSAGGSFTLNGATITLAAGQSLASVRDAINGATYAAGKEIVATVVNDSSTTSRLVLEAKSTGKDYAISLVDAAGLMAASSLGPLTVTQGAGDASFKLNGVSITGSSNTLSDVVAGLTINLKRAGGPVTIDVTGDSAGMRSKVDDFLGKFNALMDYLRDKSAVTKDSTGNYTRGPLNGYSLYTGLRSQLTADMTAQVASGVIGAPDRLYQLGIEMDANLHFVVTDSAKLNDWLASNPGGVSAFFGGESGAGKRILDRLKPFVDSLTSSSGSYLDREQNAITAEQESIDDRISSLKERLAMKEQTLRDQFSSLQALIIQATQQQQQLQSIFSTASGWGL